MPDPMGSILSQNGTKRRHRDLIRTILNVFQSKSVISFCATDQSCAGRPGPGRVGRICGKSGLAGSSSPLIFTHPRLLPCRYRGNTKHLISEKRNVPCEGALWKKQQGLKWAQGVPRYPRGIPEGPKGVREGFAKGSQGIPRGPKGSQGIPKGSPKGSHKESPKWSVGWDGFEK